MGIRLSVQKPHFLAVQQEAKRHADLPRVVPLLVLRRDGIDARALDLDHLHGPALPVAKDVVSLRAVRNRVFEQDPHNDEGGCGHYKGLFMCTTAFLYPAGLAEVASLSVHLSRRSRPFGGGRERPPC